MFDKCLLGTLSAACWPSLVDIQRCGVVHSKWRAKQTRVTTISCIHNRQYIIFHRIWLIALQYGMIYKPQSASILTLICQEVSHWRVKSSGVSQSEMLKATLPIKGLTCSSLKTLVFSLNEWKTVTFTLNTLVEENFDKKDVAIVSSSVIFIDYLQVLSV